MELWAAETRLFWSAALAELGGVGQTLCTAAPGREAAGRAWQLGAGPITLPVYLEMCFSGSGQSVPHVHTRRCHTVDMASGCLSSVPHSLSMLLLWTV